MTKKTKDIVVSVWKCVYSWSFAIEDALNGRELDYSFGFRTKKEARSAANESLKGIIAERTELCRELAANLLEKKSGDEVLKELDKEKTEGEIL